MTTPAIRAMPTGDLPLESRVNMATIKKTAIDTEGARDHQPGSDGGPADVSSLSCS